MAKKIQICILQHNSVDSSVLFDLISNAPATQILNFL
jgi:hypothetical protein